MALFLAPTLTKQTILKIRIITPKKKNFAIKGKALLKCRAYNASKEVSITAQQQ